MFFFSNFVTDWCYKIVYKLLNNRMRGLYCKIQDRGMKFLLYGPSFWARSTKQKNQPEVWNFSVKPKQTRLLSCLLYGFRCAKREIERTSTLPSFSVTIKQFRVEIFFRTHNYRRDTCFVQFIAFLTKFISAKVS